MKMVAGFLVMALGTLTTNYARAEWSGNIGWASDYYYRGIFQSRSSASGGVDFAKNGFYAGTWAADVEQGLEIDVYGGFSGQIGDVQYGLGFTGYYYTEEFDDAYEELTLSTGIGKVSTALTIGRYDNFSGPTQNYFHYAATLEGDHFYGTFAGYSKDFAGEYLQLGYNTTVSEVDIGLALILASEELAGDDTESLVVTVGKTFDF